MFDDLQAGQAAPAAARPSEIELVSVKKIFNQITVFILLLYCI